MFVVFGGSWRPSRLLYMFAPARVGPPVIHSANRLSQKGRRRRARWGGG